MLIDGAQVPGESQALTNHLALIRSPCSARKQSGITEHQKTFISQILSSWNGDNRKHDSAGSTGDTDRNRSCPNINTALPYPYDPNQLEKVELQLLQEWLAISESDDSVIHRALRRRLSGWRILPESHPDVCTQWPASGEWKSLPVTASSLNK
ncbi:hypothetical protein RRG08_005457 [Elysia crispata]|uniref:Uncharacterized protein n=1 Tax=Elysia crispata TaxID=231223 RepID=A0AAE1CQV8_9GAST|nr:hypothetical protein RRG08_005457 [Elysia crispata]